MIKRLDRLDINTADVEDASRVYERNFGFSVNRKSGVNDAQILLAGTEIRLLAGSAENERLAGLWLEAEDVEVLADRFKQAGIACAPIKREAGRRILAVEPKSSNQAPLFIFDRRA